MPVLSLDTSAEIAVSLLADDGSVLARRQVSEQRRHAELLAPMITEALAEAGIDRTALTAVVVGTGPAPFTGLRAGLVTARTLGFALGIPVHGVCSLDALAVQAYDAGLAAVDGPGSEVVVVTDARRREVYTARYRRSPHPGDVEVAAGPAVVHPATLAEDPTTAGAVVVGPGASLYPADLVAAPGAPTVVDVAVLGRLAMARAARGVEQPTEPLYLRRPDVTPSAGRKRATG